MPIDLAHMNLKERAKYLELKERYKAKLRPWYKKWWGVSLLLILALIIISSTIAGFYLLNKIKEIQKESLESQNTTLNEAMKYTISGVGTNYFLGSEGAPITIVEFSDFACPYSKKAHTILKNAVQAYPNQLKIIFRDMPLRSNSIDLAVSARCVGEQGKFWEMHDLLFENQTSLTATGEELAVILESLVGTLGINQEIYKTCFTEKKYLTDVGTDFGDGATLQLAGTPSWFINGKRLSGYIPEADFFLIIESLIKN